MMETRTQLITRLEREIRAVERILDRRGMYVDMIDWTAMTARERDWARYRHMEELHMTIWELDSRLDHLDENRWSYE
ncbi:MULTISPECIES: hypothetical protein [Sphingobium]|uniref:Uncharacterized protein n=1 Tax=Sphingobium limneticum TaxID=1007511 RepID=A0A5J5HU37_9SPHN|nr:MULTISPECIES: hypothetical protein [Sphingobium]KAA9011647.1 hypothetical protein F4U94_20275 [Sphingobium limneticum]KAA9012267.1 hypothetical protein F4U96_21480 [Sphingobium limneticum]KAA9024728.1 hypothetical protein F4U95_21595 [Sphingobium limneticum]